MGCLRQEVAKLAKVVSIRVGDAVNYM